MAWFFFSALVLFSLPWYVSQRTGMTGTLRSNNSYKPFRCGSSTYVFTRLFFNNMSITPFFYTMKLLLFFFCLPLFFCAPAQAQLPYNAGFEITDQNSGQTWEFWDESGQYSINWSAAEKHSGRYALLLNGKNATPAQSDDAGVIYFMAIPAEKLAGKKKVRLEGWIKTDTHALHASLWITSHLLDIGIKPIDEGFADTIATKTGWQHVQVEKQLDSITADMYMGGLLNGKGSAWFDDIKLYIDDKLVIDIAKPTLPPAAAEIAWLNKNAVPLLAIDSSGNNKDLDELVRWSDNAKIIAVGEPTHGTGDASRFKRRLLQYLVQYKGFNTFMIEDELPEAGLMNNYISTGKDTALSLLKKHFFAINRNEEMLEMIEWMRNYNQTHTNKIQFCGMDMQSVKVAVPVIIQLAKKYDTILSSLMNNYVKAAALFKTNTDDSKRKALLSGVLNTVKTVKTHVDNFTTAYTAIMPKDSVNWLLQNVNVLNQYYPANGSAITPVYRDSCMAKNILDYSRLYPDAKIFLWAHNFHVGKNKQTMGNWMKNFFVKAYFPIAVATASGDYSASVDFQKSTFQAFPLQNAYVGTAEYYFQKATLPNFILSLQKDSGNKAGTWLNKPLHFRNVGYMKVDYQFSPEILRNNYNALVFIRQTSHTHSYLFKKD